MQGTPLKVFIIYAHEDKPVRDKLLRQLRPLADNGEIDLWSDHEIKPGEVWDEAIRARLAQSDLVLLLVSDDFFASNYIRNVELREALARHARGETRLLPIIARHCGWEDLPALARLQVLPPDGRPVVSKEWDSPDEPYRKIYEGVKAVVRELRRPSQESLGKTSETRPKPAPNWRQLTFVAVFALVAVVGVWTWTPHSTSSEIAQTQNEMSSNMPKPPSETSKQADSLPTTISITAKEKPETEPTYKPQNKPTETTSPIATQQKDSHNQPEEKPKTPVSDLVEKPKFDRQLPAVEGMARVIKDRKQGFLNTATGQVIGWYDDAENFNNGRAYVKQNNRYFWIDKTGRCVENCQ